MNPSASRTGGDRQLTARMARRASRPDDSGASVTSVGPHATDRDWAWRRKVRSNPQMRLIYRIIVGVVGLLIVVLGLLLVPFPGPGWLIVILGLVVWASEFVWAQRLLQRTRHYLKVWTGWVHTKAWWVRSLAVVITVILVVALFWALFATSGVPGFFPDRVEQWLESLPGLRG